MKQTLLSIAALLLLSTAAMAQNGQGQRPNGQRLDRTEMIQRRTDGVVKKYGLNEEQAKQLLSLNTKYADQMGPRGGRGGGQGMRDGQRRQRPEGGDSLRQQRPQRPQGEAGQRPQGQRGPQMGGQMNEQMKAYNEELQKILTPEQYKAYQADQEERMRQFGQRGQGQRRQRQN